MKQAAALLMLSALLSPLGANGETRTPATAPMATWNGRAPPTSMK
jgi:hypothetical protein